MLIKNKKKCAGPADYHTVQTLNKCVSKGDIENGAGEVQICIYTESASHSINILSDIHFKQYTLSRSCPFTNTVS